MSEANNIENAILDAHLKIQTVHTKKIHNVKWLQTIFNQRKTLGALRFYELICKYYDQGFLTGITPSKAIAFYDNNHALLRYECPDCCKTLYESQQFCDNCGRLISWNEESDMKKNEEDPTW